MVKIFAISPDGTQIVFSYQGDLFIVSAKGGEAKQLTQHTAHDYKPVWSNDGKTIAFSSNRYGNFDVFTINASGGESKRLTYHSGNDFPTSFTPDDSEILISASRFDPAKSSLFPKGLLSEL